MGSNREQQLIDKIRQLLPDSKKKYVWTDIEKVKPLIIKFIYIHIYLI